MIPYERTVFISYRRAHYWVARAVEQNLSAHGFDVFLDLDDINSGPFSEAILRAIETRAHFLLILTPSALERCLQPGDWLLREIRHALDTARNIVPLTLPGFDDVEIDRYLPADVARQLNAYNRLSLPPEYFEAAMDRLVARFLQPPAPDAPPPLPPQKSEDAEVERMEEADVLPYEPQTLAREREAAPRLLTQREIAEALQAAVVYEHAFAAHEAGDEARASALFGQAASLQPPIPGEPGA
jgi:hypothetical protein